jgi:acyl-CoA synthetase (AMP-forming)/AMP-acid ligase II
VAFEELGSTVNAVLASGDRFSSSIAMEDGDVSWTYAEMRKQILDAVRAFIAWGVRPRDRVALCASNSARWIVAALGIQGAGGVLIPVNTRFKGDELAHVLSKGAASFALMEDLAVRRRLVENVGGADLGGVRWMETDDQARWSAFINRGREVSEMQAQERIGAIRADDISDILFTSGTTGYPKGVTFTHGQSLRGYGELGAGFGFTSADRYLLIPPFFHALAYKAGWFAAFLHGCAVLPEQRFDAEQMIDRIERDRVTMMIGPPTIFSELLARAAGSDRDLSSLRLVVPSATNVPAELVVRMRTELGIDVLTGYGLTEASAVVSYSRVGDDPELVSDSVGRPAPGVEVRIVDDDDRELPVGQVGNILVNGYNVMTGYWRDPQATAAAFTPDGRLRTGDVGSLDEHGFLRITGRKKDIILVGGFNVYPAEVERLLAQHPLVAEVAVVGVPDERLDEVPYAFVVPVTGATIDKTELVGWARDHMANFKVPRHVETVEGLPKNSSMKVLRGDLREWGKASVHRAPYGWEPYGRAD